jgi:hypothetical protein
MLCPYKFKESSLVPPDGGPPRYCECERSKCAKWIPSPENILMGDCADVVAARGLQALAVGLSKVLGGR